MKNVMLKRVQPRFQEIVEQLKARDEIFYKDIAKKTDIQPSRLSALMSGKMELSALYLAPFIWGGLITVADIYDGKPESERERRFWSQMQIAERGDLLKVLVRVQEAGLDPKSILLEALLAHRSSRT